MFSTYEDTIDYLFNALPAYQKVGGKAMKIDLSNIERLCSALGNPQNKFSCIHIAGTNGKGSVSHMLAAILARNGYRTGLYTSPHYLDFRERTRINGEKIPQGDVIQFVNQNRSLFEEIRPSFFEMTVAMAFDYFARSEVDIAVIETGLGGRLDSTNIVRPMLSIITNVGYDHMDFLGDTLPQIASEKAGIIKRQIPVLLGVRDERYFQEIKIIAEGRQSQLSLADEIATVDLIQATSWSLLCQVSTKDDWIVASLELPIGGHYQLENLRTALAAASLLKGQLDLEPDKVLQALENFVALTGMVGRFQLLADNPRIIADGGHNAEGIQGVLQSLTPIEISKLHVVLGFSKGKRLDDIIPQLPTSADYYICEARLPRAMPVNEVIEQMSDTLHWSEFRSVEEALKSAREKAKEDDLILVTGSIFVVAEALAQLGF